MIRCPECCNIIEKEDFNVSTDIAYCSLCNKDFPYHELLENSKSGEPVSSNAAKAPEKPESVHVHDDYRSMRLKYRKLDMSGLFFPIFFSLIWDTLLSVFIVAAIATPEKIDQPFPGFLWLFLTPFILVGIAMPMAAVYTMFGKREILIQDGVCTFFNGVGILGIRRRFKLCDVQSVKLERKSPYSVNRVPKYRIYLTVRLANGKVCKLAFPDEADAAKYALWFFQSHIRQAM